MDWYDHKAVEKLNDKCSKQWIKIYHRMTIARNKGDQTALKKALESLRKHEQKTALYKKKATETDYDWL